MTPLKNIDDTLPRSITNAVTGDRIRFLQSPLLGDGETLIFRCTLPAGANGAPLHSHADMHEIFEVESGALEMDMGARGKRILLAGERIEILPGVSHGFRNAIDRETRFVNISTPGAELERFLRSIYGAANDGKANSAGMPRNPLLLANALHGTGITFAGIPRLIQDALVSAMAAIARWTGSDRQLEPYWVGAATRPGLM